ncbi:LysR substrate-binding domain-containing protein [Albirhodobacter sp. R86504]|uniref:LysR family transcriptional regulator n=1 Tax=Albirhodobacter sp. R86504 TaxID=3093848 RepID=UPI003670EA17
MQDLKPLRVFLEVAALRSFAGAARRLKMTPASVTRIVAALESDLGQQLLVRTTRQVALTSAGALIAARYRPVIEEFDRVTSEIARATRPDRGKLSIAAPMSLGMRLLPPLVTQFRHRYPHIALDIQMTDAFVDINDGACDLAIRISGPPTDKSTIWRKLCEIPRVTIASPTLIERIGRPRTPDDLDPAQCLSYSARRQPETWTYRKGPLQRHIHAGDQIISNNGEFLYSLAAAGGGIVTLPGFLTRDGIERGEVAPLLTDWEIPPLYLMLYYPPYDALPPLVATFTNFFEEYIRDIDGFDFMPR